MKTTQPNDACIQADCATAEYVAPDVSIYENQDRYIIEVDLPGVKKDGVEVTVDGTTLTLVGKRTAGTSSGKPLLRECTPADYRRTFELDASTDISKIAAKVEQGVLTLTLPKADQVKPRKIEIVS